MISLNVSIVKPLSYFSISFPFFKAKTTHQLSFAIVFSKNKNHNLFNNLDKTIKKKKLIFLMRSLLSSENCQKQRRFLTPIGLSFVWYVKKGNHLSFIHLQQMAKGHENKSPLNVWKMILRKFKWNGMEKRRKTNNWIENELQIS